MKLPLFVFLLFICSFSVFSQADVPKFYLGVSYGTSYSIGDFKDLDIKNRNAGFADDGIKLDFYGGLLLDEKITLTGTLRYQIFETEIGDIISEFNVENPDTTFLGSAEDWQVYYLLVGAAYQINITRKFDFFPRAAFGPMIVTNPGINISSANSNSSQKFSRSSETGLGLGFEFGIGLRTDLGKHFSLMPTFTFSGGFATIRDVLTTTDNIVVTSDYQPKVQSFNLGLAVAYRFY